MGNILRITSTLLVVVFASLPHSSYAQKQKPDFKIQVNVVSIDVEVVDRQGKPVIDLAQNDFVVKENGSPVEISNFSRLHDLSLSLVVALGTSFMPQTNLGIAKNAISQLIHLLKPEDEICLCSFDQKDAYMEQGFTRDRTQLLGALENIGVVSRSSRPWRITRSFATPPQAGLGIDLGLAAARKGTNQRKALLLIRDRIENLGPASLEHLRESGCMLIALGFSSDSRNRLALISDQSGAGQLLLDAGEASSSDEEGNVTNLCRTVAHLLSSRYNITYHTPFPEIRGRRQIDISVPGREYRIIARRSYIP
jgi:hypothetical protein